MSFDESARFLRIGGLVLSNEKKRAAYKILFGYLSFFEAANLLERASLAIETHAERNLRKKKKGVRKKRKRRKSRLRFSTSYRFKEKDDSGILF